MNDDALYHRLRQLVGDRFDYLGNVWVLVEVLADLDSVVIRHCSECDTATMQADMYGHPRFDAQRTLTLRVSDAVGDGYSEDLLLLLEGRRGR